MVSRFVVPADGVSRILVVIKVDEGVLIFHNNVTNLTALFKHFLEIVSSGASGDASDVNLGEIWIVWLSAARGTSAWAS